jgi:hypothetical protein
MFLDGNVLQQPVPQTNQDQILLIIHMTPSQKNVINYIEPWLYKIENNGKQEAE